MFLQMLSRLPLRILYILSSLSYLLVYYIARYRVSVTRINLSKAFPDLGSGQLKEIEKKYYQTFIDSLFETIRAYSITQDEISRRVQFDAVEIINKQLQHSASVILLTAHIGNLEWLLYGTQEKLNVPIDPVYRPAHNSIIDKFIFAVRSRKGGTPIPYKRMAKDFLLRRDIPRCIAIPADLRPRRRERTIEIRFLNQPTRFFSSIERLAIRYEIPILFMSMHRTGRGKYKVSATLLSDGSQTAAEQGTLTEHYAKLVEKQIRTQPESWLWSHKRWKI